MGGYYYITKAGDMWDYIAWQVYKDETYMQQLMSAEENRTLLEIYIFAAGVSVWCPYIDDAGDEEDVDTIPDWRDSGDEEDDIDLDDEEEEE